MGNSPSKKSDKSSGSSPSSEFGTGGNSEVNTPRSSNSPFEQPNQPSSDYNHNNITSSESHSNLNSSPAQPQPQSTTNLGSPNSKEGITVDKNNSNDSNYSTEVDVDDVLSRLLEIGHSGRVPKTLEIEKGEIQALCQLAREILLSQPSLIELSAPVKVVGDIHGQYPDLIRMFDMCGYPPSSNFLFLGDYVDRGQQSIETMLLLLCFKIKYPENFFLLRGNHECANVTRVYGFYDECKRRASVKVWKSFVSVFNCLPLASVIANKIFCIHGGLSPSLNTMDDIRKIVRPSEIPDYGLLNDLLWSDPSETTQEWEDNDRGVSYCFGKAVVDDFLARQEFDLVCRAHMVVEDGYEFFNGRTLVTIFSAPNYCGEFDNYGAVMAVNEELLCSFELLKPIENKLLSSEPQPQLSLPFYDTEADP